MTAPWWNENFQIRRQLTVPAASFSTDSHLLVQLSNGFVNSYKTRTDLQDIEVIYWDGENSYVLASLAEIESDDDDEEFLNIKCARHTDQTTASTNYYLYMTNQSLRGINYYRPVLPIEQGYLIKPGYPGAYFDTVNDATPSTPIPAHPGPYSAEEFYSQEAIPGESSRFTVTRPTEDWKNGLSDRQNASASFIYSGGGAALRYQAGPDRGIVKIVTNSSSTTLLDTYSNKYEYKFYYFTDDISSDYGFTHTFFVTGDKSPNSSGYSIKIDRMLYTHYDQVDIGAEELFGGDTKTYVIGV